MPATVDATESPTRTTPLPFDPAEVAGRFGTPTYLYNAATIHARIDDLQRDGVTIRYAQKANSNLAILDLMRRRGVEVDAVTAGEIHRALTAGYPPEEVVFTADLLDRRALAAVAEHRCPVNCGSADMIPQLAAAGLHDTPVTPRLNPGFGHGHSRKVNTGGTSSKHGIWHTQLSDVLNLARESGIAVHGLHMHIGSGADFDHLADVCGAMEAAARTFVDHPAGDSGLHVISSGGGLPIDYHRHTRADSEAERFDTARFLDMWLACRDRIRALAGDQVGLEVEPGRFLVAESGYLLTEVRAVKRQGGNGGGDGGGDGMNYTLIDAGFNDLVRPSFYGAHHHISIHPTDGSSASTGADPTAVAGPLCESCDVFTQEEDGTVTTRDLPPATPGDLLVLHDAGAYGFAMASNYNSRCLPAELLLHNNQLHEIRRRQTVDDLVALESMPA